MGKDVCEASVSIRIMIFPRYSWSESASHFRRLFDMIFPLRQRAGGGGAFQFGRKSCPVFKRTRGSGPILPRIGRRHFRFVCVSERGLLQLQGNANYPVLPDQRPAPVRRCASGFGAQEGVGAGVLHRALLAHEAGVVVVRAVVPAVGEGVAERAPVRARWQVPSRSRFPLAQQWLCFEGLREGLCQPAKKQKERKQDKMPSIRAQEQPSERCNYKAI